MCVSIRIARPYGLGIDLDLDAGLLRSGRIEDELAMNVLEMPANVGNHHVPHREFRGGMSWFEKPFRHESAS